MATGCNGHDEPITDHLFWLGVYRLLLSAAALIRRRHLPGLKEKPGTIDIVLKL
jgi:hypothetical protein